MREAPSITIINGLIKEGAKIKAFDPVAMEQAKLVLPNIEYCEDTYQVADNSDALIFITEWNQFRSLDLEKIKTLLKEPVVIDLRNIYEPKRMKNFGFSYFCVGR